MGSFDLWSCVVLFAGMVWSRQGFGTELLLPINSPGSTKYLLPWHWHKEVPDVPIPPREQKTRCEWWAHSVWTAGADVGLKNPHGFYPGLITPIWITGQKFRGWAEELSQSQAEQGRADRSKEKMSSEHPSLVPRQELWRCRALQSINHYKCSPTNAADEFSLLLSFPPLFSSPYSCVLWIVLNSVSSLALCSPN